MADFCSQCSIRIFGKDFGDLAGLGDGRTLPEDHGWRAICEGCGHTVVNADGECIHTLCDRHGQKLDIG